MFVFEPEFISEQIAENRFEALFEVSDKFITEFNVSYMILQFRLNTVSIISKPYCMTLKQWLGSFASKVIVCTTKVRDELLEMAKDLKIKHSVSSPPYKVLGNFFHKKALHGGTNVLEKFCGGCFTWGLMIRSCKGGR